MRLRVWRERSHINTCRSAGTHLAARMDIGKRWMTRGVCRQSDDNDRIDIILS